MKNCNNSKMNIRFPQQQQGNEQSMTIIYLGFMCIMLFGLVIALLVAVKI